MTFCVWAESLPEVFWFCLFVSEADTLFFLKRIHSHCLCCGTGVRANASVPFPLL